MAGGPLSRSIPEAHRNACDGLSSHFPQVDDPARIVQEIKRFDENSNIASVSLGGGRTESALSLTLAGCGRRRLESETLP